MQSRYVSYAQKLFDQAKQSDTDGPKAASKRGIQKSGKATETNLQTKNPIDIPRYILYTCILYIYIIYIIYIYISRKKDNKLLMS